MPRERDVENSCKVVFAGKPARLRRLLENLAILEEEWQISRIAVKSFGSVHFVHYHNGLPPGQFKEFRAEAEKLLSSNK